MGDDGSVPVDLVGTSIRQEPMTQYRAEGMLDRRIRHEGAVPEELSDQLALRSVACSSSGITEFRAAGVPCRCVAGRLTSTCRGASVGPRANPTGIDGGREWSWPRTCRRFRHVLGDPPTAGWVPQAPRGV